MARLTCSCLNINVHSASTEWQDNPIHLNKLVSDEWKDDLVIGNGKDDILYEITLDVAGIVIEQKALVCNRRIEDWIVYSCSNCNTDVYVAHAIKGDRTFVTSNLLCNCDAILRVTQEENFSSIFNILLRTVHEEDAELFRRKRVSSMSFGREDPDMKIVHQQMKQYLKLEEEAMEERISLFEEQQRKAFFALQEKAHRERRLLFAAIAKAQENVISEEIKIINPDTKMQLSSSKPIPASHDMNVEKVENPTTKKVTITIQDSSPHPLTKLSGTDETGENSLFTLEGFDEEQVYEESIDGTSGSGDIAFPQSDDEVSTNDSSYRDISVLNLATSVPVSIPLFHKTNEASAPTSNQNNDAVVDDVGNSIRQLALSVQDTGMFGDLPRPRIMTSASSTQH